MARGDWARRLRRVPLLGGLVAMLGMLRDVYDAVGWTDPGYHSIRSPEERLAEARRVATIGDRPGSADAQVREQPWRPDETNREGDGNQQTAPESSQTLRRPRATKDRADPNGNGQQERQQRGS